MRPESFEVTPRPDRAPRTRAGSSPSSRAARRRAVLEPLEPRTLLATLPEPIVDPGAIGAQAERISASQGHEFGSYVAVSPIDPSKMVTVWTSNNEFLPDEPTTSGGAAYSVDGGATWQSFGISSFVRDFTTDPDTFENFDRNIVAGVGIDRDEQLYVLMIHNDGVAEGGAGALTLQRFDFSGSQPERSPDDGDDERFTTSDPLQDVVGTPGAPNTRRVVHAWVDDVAVDPTLVVDTTLEEFVDPETGEVQSNPHHGNIYVAWTTLDAAPGADLPGFNPTAVKIVASSDGGETFTAQRIVNDARNSSLNERNVDVRLAVSQGVLESRAAASDDPVTVGGQVTMVWDDFGTQRNSTPPQSRIQTDRIEDGGRGALFVGGGGTIADRPDGGDPQVTTFTIQDVDLPSDFDITDLDVRINLRHPALQELSIVLVAPNDDSVTLINQEADSGANLGLSGNANIGTVFDQDAPRNINDFDLAGNRTAAGPFLGHFQPRGGSSLDIYGTEFAPRNGDELDGDWQLVITDFANGSFPDPPDTPALINWSLSFTAGLTPGTDATIATSTVTAVDPEAFPDALEVGPGQPVAPNGRGLRAQPVIASDNTLGSFSPYQGRLYVAWTGRVEPINPPNPVDNYDIFMSYSDDGGRTWVGPTLVNDDFGGRDGFSSGTGGLYAGGRPPFFPAVDVDDATGTLVVGFLDTRHDTARVRYVTTLTTSIDGGQTFSPQANAYANTKRVAVDATRGSSLTRQTAVVIGPQPDNQSANFPENPTFGQAFGLDLVAIDGRIRPVWSGNENFAGIENDGADGAELTDIYTNDVRFAAGPRILSGTQGPIDVTTAPIVDGRPAVNSFVVEFDRPIGWDFFGPHPFGPEDVRVFFEGVDGGTPVDELAVESVEPLDFGARGPAGALTASRFLVRFEQSNRVGSYSYLIRPDLHNRIRFFTSGLEGQDEIVQGSGAISVRIPPSGTGGPNTPNTSTHTITVNADPADVITDINVTVDIQHEFLQDLVLTLVHPNGNSVPLAANRGGSGDFYFGTIFDDEAGQPIGAGASPFIGSFRPEGSLASLDGLVAAGDYTLVIEDTAGNNIGTLNSWSVTIQRARRATVRRDGAFMDQNADGVTVVPGADGIVPPEEFDSLVGRSDTFTVPTMLEPIRLDVDDPIGAPFARGTLPLIVPGPSVVEVRLPAEADPSPTNPRLSLNGRVSALEVVFDRDMDGDSFGPADVSRLIGPAGILLQSPRVNNPSDVPPENPFTVEQIDARTFLVRFPEQELSGTYSLVLGSDILSADGTPLDSSLDAGAAATLGRALGESAPRVTVEVGSGPIADGALLDGESRDFLLVFDQDFEVPTGGFRLRLDLTHPDVRDLTGELIAVNDPADPDDDVPITLFSPQSILVSGADFDTTIFTDRAGATPIQESGPPFFSPAGFNPEDAFTPLFPLGSAGQYILRITDNDATDGQTATLNNWALLLDREVTGTGLGEEVADRVTGTFRIFTMDPAEERSSTQWTPVGPAPIGAGSSAATNISGTGRVSAIAVDPSDLSGNTVYVGGASGGVWKTTNFLTDDPSGPTYIPLTDLGPDSSVNIGALDVFARDGEPDRSIIFAGTGEADDAIIPGLAFGDGQTSRGVGFLRSVDGGRSWQLLDSRVNFDDQGNPLPIDHPDRDHIFVGTSVFRVVTDPTPTPEGETIVYAAVVDPRPGNPAGGFWRSLDSGRSWQRMRAGQATEIVLDGFSPSESTGNIQRLFVGFQGEGVFLSPNRGQVFQHLVGNDARGEADNALRKDPDFTDFPIPVQDPPSTPSGNRGRIVMARPRPTGDLARDLTLQGYIYAAVAEPNQSAVSLYVSRDFGQVWTEVTLPNLLINGQQTSIFTNDPNSPDYDFGGTQGNHALSLAIDPTDPNVVYLGGTRSQFLTTAPALIRIDTKLTIDGHGKIIGSNNAPDGGLLFPQTFNNGLSHEYITVKDPLVGSQVIDGVNPLIRSGASYLAMVRNPFTPFLANATFFVSNVDEFLNSGLNTGMSAFDAPLAGSNGVHRLLTVVDPRTGQPRLLIGTDNGVFTGVDDDGTMVTSVGNAAVPGGSRNGNLQISQFYFGAVQPSDVAAQVAGALFYGMSEDNGFPFSSADILDDTSEDYGRLAWGGVPFFGTADPLFNYGTGSGVATAQVETEGTTGDLYQYKFPSFGGRFTDFFQVDSTGRTFGLDANNRSRWPSRGPILDPGLAFGDFAINPLSNEQAILGDNTGAVFATEDQGRTWVLIGDPSAVGGSPKTAYAFGAPDPDAPGGIGNLNNFLYIGTNDGRLFVSQTGGGTPGVGNAWIDISTGLDGSSVVEIVPHPDRGNRSAYAVTQAGVYYIENSIPDPLTNPTPTWQAITGDPLDGGLFGLTQLPFGNPDLAEPHVEPGDLHSMVVDWRYIIPTTLPDDLDPEDDSYPSGPAFPILYVAGESGVFRSVDNGQSWTSFPDNIADDQEGANTPADYGYLPNVRVTDLDLSLGFTNPDNGRPEVDDRSENLLLATTFGRGSFAIRLAPLVIDASVGLSNLLPNPPGPPSGSDSGSGFDPNAFEDRVTNVTRPVFSGIGEQTAFGNVVRISVFDLTDPDNPRLIGGYDPDDLDNTDVEANRTDGLGRFFVQVDEELEDGTYIIGIQAVNGSGTRGNMVVLGDRSYLDDDPTNDDPTNPPLVIDTQEPDAPTDLDLQATSDSQPPADSLFPPPPTGEDNYTNVADPAFDVAGVEPGNTLLLFRSGVRVTVINDAAPDPVTGLVRITDTGVPDGTYTYAVQQIDRAGNEGPFGDGLEVTVDTLAPQTPSSPAMDPADDSGTVGDNATNVRQPRLTGTLTLAPNETTPENLPLVRLVTSDGTVIGRDRVAADGVFSIRVDTPLADDIYLVQAEAIDRAGNISPLGEPLALRIDSTSPSAVTLGLSPTDDTGAPGDNITSVRRPRLIGTTGAGLRVDLIAVSGNIPGAPAGAIAAGPVTSQANGSFLLQLPFNLPDGTYTVLARATNDVGNSVDSLPLTLTILNEVTVGVPTLRLAPESDTGVIGDGRTTDRRPVLVGEAEPDATIEIVGPDGTVLASGTADAQGDYRLQLAGDLANGTIELRARSRGASGVAGPFSIPLVLTIESATGDFDEDARADLILYRPGPADGDSLFLVNRSSGGSRVVSSADFQSSDPASPLFDAELRPDDIPLTGDFDGDGVADLAAFRPSSDRMPGASEWLILGSRTGPRSILFGGSFLDQPAPGDFDGDGITDIAVFRPVSDLLDGAAEWFILHSSTGQGVRILFGGAGGLDVPAVGDFDGDGRDDIAVFRPDSDLIAGASQWFILPSGPNDVVYSQMLDGYSVLFGEAGVDQPVPLDYDGDGLDDVATFRPTTSEWFIMRSSLPADRAGLRVAFGSPGDLAAPADYDGDGTADLAAFRPETGRWTIRQSTDSQDMTIDFGASGDIPVLGPLAARDPRMIAASASATRTTPAAGLGVAQAAQRAGSPAPTLDLGGQASRLSRSSSASRVRPAQAPAAGLSGGLSSSQDLRDAQGERQGESGGPASGLRGLLSGLIARRRGLGPKA